MGGDKYWILLTLCLGIFVAEVSVSKADLSFPHIRTSPYQEPVDKCTSDGQKVCASCDVLGVCVSTEPGVFEIQVDTLCEKGEYCSEDYDTPGPGCYRLAPYLSPVCACYENKTCNIDPFDPKDYVVCKDEDSIEYGSCGRTEIFDLDLCSCEDACFSCGFYFPGPGDNCTSYYECGDGIWSQKSCAENYCFNPDTCECEFDCPPCGYVPYPNNDTLYISCADGNLVVHTCVEGSVFDPENCSCERIPLTTMTSSTATQTSSQTTKTTTEYDQCAMCGFYEYPGSCSKYYKCYQDDTVTVEECPGNLCFNPDNCFCENNCDFCPGTSSPNATDPCDQCGFYPYEGSCTKFYGCNKDSTLTVMECPVDFCFIPENCFCQADCVCIDEDGFPPYSLYEDISIKVFI